MCDIVILQYIIIFLKNVICKQHTTILSLFKLVIVEDMLLRKTKRTQLFW